MTPFIWSLGLMSGTSCDGIDAALIKTDGHTVKTWGPTYFFPYLPQQQKMLLETCQDHTCQQKRLQATRTVTQQHVQAIKNFLRNEPLFKPAIIGFHGQTLFHYPERGQTCQVGDAAKLFDVFQIPIVYDFRTQDMLNGGQGAPLVPVFHQAIAKEKKLPLAIVNIGGISNVTIVYENGTISAADVGPGNALIDDWMAHHQKGFCDLNGETAKRGTVNKDLLQSWLNHTFFAKPFPKSLDRYTFSNFFDQCKEMCLENGAATLTAFTAEAILKSIPPFIEQLVITGGGRKNTFLIDYLRHSRHVETTESVGWDGDFMEAQAFAFLAVRSFYGLPLSFPATTGVSRPTCGGQLMHRLSV